MCGGDGSGNGTDAKTKTSHLFGSGGGLVKMSGGGEEEIPPVVPAEA